jgi:hypothetical protein
LPLLAPAFAEIVTTALRGYWQRRMRLLEQRRAPGHHDKNFQLRQRGNMLLNFRRLLRPTLILPALLLPALPLQADIAAPAAGTFVSNYEADLRLLYDEALVIGGASYSYQLYISADQTAVRELDARLNAGGKRAPLSSVMKLPTQQSRAYATPAPLREQLQKLAPGQTSGAFQLFKTLWAVVELKAVDRAQAVPPYAELRDSLMRLVGSRALPDAATLRGRNAEQKESAQLARVGNTRAFDQLPPGTDLDKPLTSGYTLLQRALREDQPELVRALLEHRANTNLCYVDTCPLQIALDSKTNAASYVAQLLDAGAKPDQLPGLPGESTTLALAAQRGQLDVVKLLLARGADPLAPKSTLKPLQIATESGNAELQMLLLARSAAPAAGKGTAPAGDAGVPSPLHLALANGNREIAQHLLDEGADLLLQRPLPGSAETGAPLMAALAAGKPEIAAWFRPLLLKKLATRAPYRWSAWIEQEVLAPPSKDPNAPLVNILRYPLKPGARITLNRERFTLHVRMPAQAELRLEAVTGARFFEELDTFAPTPPLLNRKRISSSASRSGALLVGEARARAADPDATGGVLALSGRTGFDRVEKSPEGPVYVRIVDKVKVDNGSSEVTLPLEKSSLRELSLVLGMGVDYGATLGDLVNPQKVTLVFR